METLAGLLELDGLPVIGVLDIGAMPEGEDRYAPLAAQGLARVVGFEPNDASRAELTRLHGETRTYLPYFLGTGGPATFFETVYPGCASLYEPDPSVIDLFATFSADPKGANFGVVATHAVETTRLDDVAQARGADYLKIDVQGAELDVLRGGAEALNDVLVLECEAEFVALYKDQPLFADLDGFLRDQGFMLHKFLDMGGRAYSPFVLDTMPRRPISQLLWADAVYVRPPWTFEAMAPDRLLKLATILHDVYGSFDLVGVVLGAHDRIVGGTLAMRYRKALSRASLTLPPFANIRGDL